jgi:protease I
MKALILAGQGFEDSELLFPYFRLLEEDISVVVASPKKEKLIGKYGYTYDVDLLAKDVDPKDFDLLIIPGGKGPERIRRNNDIRRIAKEFMSENKPVASICHGAQVLISSAELKGRRMTSYEGILDDLEVAGVIVSDEEVVVDDNLVTSRKPEDLPAFMRETMKLIRQWM